MNTTTSGTIMDELTAGAISPKDIVEELIGKIDIADASFQLTLFFIAFNPIFWNIIARLEHSTHFLTQLAGNNAKRGCYILAIIIFSLGIGRDMVFQETLNHQESSVLLELPLIRNLGVASFLIGQLLVITSMYQLGITGTYLGDYFGILMNERVTGFPFNVSNNPMYHGSTLSFLGTSLYFAKPSGVAITAFVYMMYCIALRFEEPFTAAIYAKRDAGKLSKNI
ncbi:hypothetical protein NCAS_0A12330 [Naumovozyma castellii]|uniref:Phosphatidyl-N-methylethanolamine N-methyltransferase n=1 Tax=Naumovozyma castellii TaxID=27288 RepID=G0V8J2_NAUCA|nr:hypothetical protein NCAS_0A12330 [Naumovozyma castellii CBS 4309]CCC67791.1 hypothetical protein NCAS_0A12330 [Naumovozyma castellii CBS 4309]